jgi:uncharacterized coiled-coil protein SlyX
LDNFRQSHRQQQHKIASLEQDNLGLNHQLAEKNQQIDQMQSETRQLTDALSKMTAKNNELENWAKQLESFRQVTTA